MNKRLMDAAKREWGNQLKLWKVEAGTGREHYPAPGGGCDRNGAEKGSQESGMRMKSQRGKLGNEGSEVVVTMVECTGAVEDSAESCRKGAREGV